MSILQASVFKEYKYKMGGKKTDEEKKKLQELKEKERDEDSELVTGIFRNKESKNGLVKFPYKKYKEDPYTLYEFENGKTYTIPLGVAKWINNGTQVKEREYATSPDGAKQLYTIVRSLRNRYEFVSTKFN
jgi:hypothetical protein